MSIVFRVESPAPDLLEELRQIPGVKAYETAIRCTPDIAPVVAEILGQPGTSTITKSNRRAVTPAAAGGTTRGWDRLTPWQQESALALANGSKFGIVHPCGSGKSATVLAALDLIGASRALVVTRSIGREAYARDAAWISNRKVALLIGTSTSTAEAQARRTDRALQQYRERGATCVATSDLTTALEMDTVVVGWETLAERCDKIGDQIWNVMVTDEAHMAKGRTSRRCKAAHELRKIIPRCWTATATPVRDRLRDLWAQLYLVSPEAFKSSIRFAYRYCDAKPGRYGGLDTTGASHTDELKTRLCYWWDVRSAEETRAGLPAKRRTTVRVPASKRNGTRSDTGSGTRYSATSAIEAAIATAAAAKIDTVAELAAEALIGDQKVVIVGNRRAWLPRMVATLERALTGAPRHIRDRLWIRSVSGEIPVPDRLQVAHEYMDRPGAACLIATIDSVSECVRPDELLLGENKPISEFCRSEKVISATGVSEVCATSKRRYSGDMITLKAQGLLPICATPNHPVLVIEAKAVRNMQGERRGHWRTALTGPVWKRIESVRPWDCKEGDFLLVPRLAGVYESVVFDLDNYTKKARGHHKVRATRKLPRHLKLTEKLAWFLGLYTAEGYSGHNGPVEICLGAHETALIRRTRAAVKAFGFRSCIVKGKGIYSGGTKVVIGSWPLGRLLRELCGHKAKNKQIPAQVLLNKDVAILQAFLSGYVSGDGSRFKGPSGEGVTSIGTVSRTLAMQVQLAVARLGKFSSVYSQYLSGRRIRGRLLKPELLYQVRWRDKVRHHVRHKMFQNYIAVPVQKTSKALYEGDVCNLETSDHTYLVSNAVVHNSIDLHDSDLALVAALPYTPGQVSQFEGRFMRLGQKRPVLIQYLVADRTIDEEIESMLLNKIEAAEEAGCIVDGTGLDTGLRMSESDIVAGLEKWLADQS